MNGENLQHDWHRPPQTISITQTENGDPENLEARLPLPFPAEFERRYRAWERISRSSSIFHDFVSIFAVGGPVLIAAVGRDHPTWGAVLAVASSLAAVALTRVKPNSARIAYRRAWRRLDHARYKYIWGIKDISYIIRVVREAERIIERMQNDFDPNEDDYHRGDGHVARKNDSHKTRRYDN